MNGEENPWLDFPGAATKNFVYRTPKYVWKLVPVNGLSLSDEKSHTFTLVKTCDSTA